MKRIKFSELPKLAKPPTQIPQPLHQKIDELKQIANTYGFKVGVVFEP